MAARREDGVWINASEERALIVVGADGAAAGAAIAGTATLSNVADTASSATLLAANTARLGAIVVNDSTVTLYLKYGATASATSFTYLLTAGATWEMPASPRYTGIITGIWASDASGSARVTELTA